MRDNSDPGRRPGSLLVSPMWGIDGIGTRAKKRVLKAMPRLGGSFDRICAPSDMR
jgi:hypothetical protein